MTDMTLPLIAKAVNGRLYINGAETDTNEIRIATEAESVVIDSRLCEKNSIFVAIKGEKADGHDFIEKVLDEGALGAICEKLPEGYEKRTKGAYILVEDSLTALRSLAAYYRSRLDVKITGIVGSVGKTSTKELVASVLSVDYETSKTAGNFNNEIGVPLTIFKIGNEHKMAVVEMGISGFGEMNRLGEIVKPDIVVMTNIGPCHLENLKDLDGVLRAKSEVLRHIKKGGLLVVNSDDPKLYSLKELKDGKAKKEDIIEDIDKEALKDINVLCYGSNGDVTYNNIISKGVEGSTFTMKIDNPGLYPEKRENNSMPGKEEPKEDKTEVSVSIKMQGNHQVMNSLAASIVGLVNGMTPEHIIKGIAAAVPVKGRCCPLRTDRFLVVDDSYNANPKSMKAGIDLMAESKGRKILILGDMFELGENEKELHREVGEYAAGKNIDVLICVGELSRNMYDGFIGKSGRPGGDTDNGKKDSRPDDGMKSAGNNGKTLYFETKEELLSNLEKLGLKDGDTIFIKASHGMGFAEVVDKLVELGTKYRFVKGREKMKIDDIMELLSQTHWACKRSRKTVEKAIENSLCFGIVDEEGRQIAFGRTVTDYATMFYVSDVVVDKNHQKHGLGGRFVQFIKSAEELKDLWGFLGTTKAKGFYSKFGFEEKDDFFMAMPKTNVKGIFNV